MTPAPATEKDSQGQTITPKPVDGQKPVPVILVHGWNGDPAGTFLQPINLFADGGDGGDGVTLPFSVTGSLERVPGVAVYTFDYSQYSNRWVTDSAIGPRLASAIECLTNYYGTKAEIVAHSMGGLATRYALAQSTASGPPISGRVGSVITFGTPNTGSAIATLAANGLNKGALDGLVEPNLVSGAALGAWVFTSICGRKITESTAAAQSFPCKVPAVLGGQAIAGFDSDAARAMRVGSPELKALAPWPSGIRVIAVSGSTMLKGVSLFGANLAKDGLNSGDVIVLTDSATAGSTVTKDDSCGYALVARNVTGDTIMRAIGVNMGASQDGDLSHLVDGTNPCFHANLLRTINGTNMALNEIRTAAKDAAPVSGVAGGNNGAGPTSAPSSVSASGMYLDATLGEIYSLGKDKGIACGPGSQLFCLAYQVRVRDKNGNWQNGCHLTWTFTRVGAADPIDKGRLMYCQDDLFVGQTAIPPGDYVLSFRVELDDGSVTIFDRPITLYDRCSFTRCMP